MRIGHSNKAALALVPGHGAILKALDEIKAVMRKAGGTLECNPGAFFWQMENGCVSLGVSLGFDVAKLKTLAEDAETAASWPAIEEALKPEENDF